MTYLLWIIRVAFCGQIPSFLCFSLPFLTILKFKSNTILPISICRWSHIPDKWKFASRSRCFFLFRTRDFCFWCRWSDIFMCTSSLFGMYLLDFMVLVVKRSLLSDFAVTGSLYIYLPVGTRWSNTYVADTGTLGFIGYHTWDVSVVWVKVNG